MSCKVEGCDRKLHGSNYCDNHYRQWLKYGDPLYRKNRLAGEGSRRIDGYLMHESGGRSVLNHILVAETALGHQLPVGAEVHHVDGDRGNDANSNLVICPNKSYHALLHKRMRAMDSCGHADWLKCWICKEYGPDVKQRSNNNEHRECFNRYEKQRKAI